MKRVGAPSFSIFVIFCLLAITERRAYGFSGYIDPGSGLLALQCISSVVLATGYYLRRQIRSLFSRKDRSVSKTASMAEGPRDAS